MNSQTETIQIHVNGEVHQIAEGTTVAMLLAEFGFSGKAIAVEINQEISVRENHDSQRLRKNDWIEIVSLVGGG